MAATLSVEVDEQRAFRMNEVDTTAQHTAAGSDTSQFAASVALGDLSSSKRKLDELFFHWMGLEQTGALVAELVDDAKAGRPLPISMRSSSPLSPVSKLLSGNPTIDNDWSPSRHQPATPPRSPKSPGPRGRVAVRDGLPPASPKAGASTMAAATTTLAASVECETSAQPIPQFYFPLGQAIMHPTEERRLRHLVDELFAAASAGPERGETRGGFLGKAAMREVATRVAGLPRFFGGKLFGLLAKIHDATSDTCCTDGSGLQMSVSKADFLSFWEDELKHASPAARVFATLKQPGASHVIARDWHVVMQELLTTHPGLEFLQDTEEFQARYVETVITRIFYTLDRRNLGRISMRDIQRSELLPALKLVDEDDDINKELRFFSYEHFYVIYCKFWELDSDHDLEISRDELLRYGNHALTRRMVDRIFSQEPRRFYCTKPGRMGYHDFAHFCLSEEDKTADTSIEFWFRCCDLDNDGVITRFDIEHFYREQLYRMHCLNVEAVSIADLLIQLNDMVHPAEDTRFTLADLRKRSCRANIPHFFNALCNLGKFVAHETRDPHSIRQQRMLPEMTDWERFAQREYVRMANEEEEEEEGEEEDVIEGVQYEQGHHESPF